MSCVGLAPTLCPVLAEPELCQMFGGGLKEISLVSRNKSWKLRGGCHFTLGNTMSDVHCASSHGSYTPSKGPSAGGGLESSR